jgi:hypothetical protein
VTPAIDSGPGSGRIRSAPASGMTACWAFLAGLVAAGSGGSGAAPVPPRPSVVRLPGNPIVAPGMLPGDGGANINGPSLIRVPPWAPGRLGRYYLYFAHHLGRSIRLAYADRLEGPWRIHPGGTLRLADAPGCAAEAVEGETAHLASPDVHVDDDRRRIRMYFHCLLPEPGDVQKSFLAVSDDGIRFEAGARPIGEAYLRAFPWRGAWYAFGWGGRLHRSADGERPFEPGPDPFSPSRRRATRQGSRGPRHLAVQVDEEGLWVYHSDIGDAPERIRRSRLDPSGDWTSWRVRATEEVLAPERDYEGAELPVRESRGGAAPGRVRQLRDPCIFREDGRTFLVYSVAGESGIAIAEVIEAPSGDRHR